MGTADPHEPPSCPALLRSTSLTPSVVRGGAPERVYDESAADPAWTPSPVGFTAHLAWEGRFTAHLAPAKTPVEREPLLWEGQD